ncbi:Phospholipase ddhd1 [Sparganum proliferum]
MKYALLSMKDGSDPDLFYEEHEMQADSVSDVRWFYKGEGGKKWLPFSGHDSIKIETHFQATLTQKTGRDEVALQVRGDLFEVDITRRKCYPIYWDDKPTPILRGTWFRDPGGPQCIPIDDELMAEQIETKHIQLLCEQQKESSEDNTDEQLHSTSPKQQDAEMGSTPKEKSSGDYLPLPSIFSSTNKSQCIQTVQFSDCHVEWYSTDEIYIYMETTGLYIRKKLGMPKGGTKLGRGYFEEATLDDRQPEVAHLCFVVHGMGQKFLKGSIVKSCDDLRSTSQRLLESYFPDVTASQKRVEFLPVEWRTSLQLGGDILDSLTLNNVGRLRYFLNSTFMDIMYYSSPLYRSEISRNLLTELNRLYSLFRDRHPYFERDGGRVSILSHSLGSVIAYDLITGWVDPTPVSYCNLQPADPPCARNPFADTTVDAGNRMADGTADETNKASILLAKLESAKEVVKCLESQLQSLALQQLTAKSSVLYTSTQRIHLLTSCYQPTARLIFASRLENLFCVGSPLPVYLALRGVRPDSSSCPDKVMPRHLCRHIYNVFHPSDPVAYRLEPLILKHYSDISPVEVYRCSDAAKVNYQEVHTKSNSKPPLPVQHSVPEWLGREASSRDNCRVPSPDRSTSIPEDLILESTLSTGSLRRRLSLTNLVLGLFRGSWDENQSESPSQVRATVSKRSKATFFAEDDACPPSEERPAEAEDHPDGGGGGSGPDERPCRQSSSRSTSPDSQTANQRLEYRMDYRLPESRYESTYLSALTVHTSYWTNPDVVMFVLMQVFTNSAPLDHPLSPL